MHCSHNREPIGRYSSNNLITAQCYYLLGICRWDAVPCAIVRYDRCGESGSMPSMPMYILCSYYLSRFFMWLPCTLAQLILSNGPSNDNICHTRGRKLFETLLLHVPTRTKIEREQPPPHHCYLRRTHPGQFDGRHNSNLHIAVGFDVARVKRTRFVGLLAELSGWRKCPKGNVIDL